MLKLTRLNTKSYKVTGIVIKRKNFFEADRIISIFTKEKGLIRCVVKGARKSTSKLSGISELFVYGEFTLAKGKNLDILTASVPREYFQKSTQDLVKISQLFLVSETLGKLLPQEVPFDDLYNETISFFRIVNEHEKSCLLYEYLYKASVLLGYGLSLDACAKCHEENIVVKEKDNLLSLERGGILCEKCISGNYSTIKISKDTLKMLKYIERNSIEEYSKISFDESVERQISNVVNLYLNHIYQREMKSPGFIKDVKALKK